MNNIEYFENLKQIRQDQFIKEMIKLYNNKFDFTKFQYINRKTLGIVVCIEHNLEFLQRPSSLIKGHCCGCKMCVHLFKKNQLGPFIKRVIPEEFFNKMKILHHDKYIYFDDYVNNYTNIKAQCKDCGSIFYVSPKHHKERLTGCQNCKPQFAGPTSIIYFLNEHNIKYIREYMYNDCKGIKRKLPFDFYLPEYNILIEFDGKQHSDKTSKYYSLELIKNDKIKTKYCKKNNIKLIRISYKQINNIESILDKELVLVTIK